MTKYRIDWKRIGTIFHTHLIIDNEMKHLASLGMYKRKWDYVVQNADSEEHAVRDFASTLCVWRSKHGRWHIDTRSLLNALSCAELKKDPDACPAEKNGIIFKEQIMPRGIEPGVALEDFKSSLYAMEIKN